MNNPGLHSYLPKRSLLYFAAALIALSFLSAWYFNILPTVGYHQKQLQHYLQKQEEDARTTLSDTALIRRLIVQTETANRLGELENKKYGLFLFAETISDNQDLLYWNNQKVLPPATAADLPDGEYFEQLANGYYSVIKKTLTLPGLNNRNVIAYAMIPILNQYYSGALPARFAHDAEAINKISIASTATPFPIKGTNNKILFYIKGIVHTSVAHTDTVTIVLRLLAFIFLLMYVHILAETIAKKRVLYGVLFLAFTLIALRVALYIFPHLLSLRQFSLFDPTIYAANAVNRSLGDLLINAVLCCWLVLFTWYNVVPVKNTPYFLAGKRIYAAGVVALFALIYATFQLANIVHSLVADSKISFYVTDFFSLDIFTVFGLIVLALLSLSFYYFSRLLFRFIFPAFRDHPVYIYFLMALVGLIFLTFRSGNAIVLFHLPVLAWLILYTLLFSRESFVINRLRITVAGVLFWIFVFSISLASVILVANKDKEVRIRKGIAEKYDQLTDPSNDRTLSIALTYLDNRFLLNNFSRFKNPEESKFIRDSIIRSSFAPGYTLRYDTRLYIFDSLNRGIYNDDEMSFPELNTILSVQSKPTGIPDLFYHETSFDQYTYITRRNIRNDNHVLGSFFIVSSPKQFRSTDALYPELFRQANKSRDFENSPNYSYAIYKNSQLISASSKYPFPISLTPGQIPRGEFVTDVSGDYNELWYKASNKKIVVVAKKRDTLLESITLFSYLFCAFLFMVGLIQLISFGLSLAADRRSFRWLGQFSIRSQIHGTFIFVSVLSFLIIGAATISFFISRYQRNNVDKISRTAGIMVKELQKRLIDTTGSALVFDSSEVSNLQRLVNEVSDIHGVDVNVYDLKGNLQVTSEDLVYQKGILSTKMHPDAYYHLDRLRQVQHVQEENISSLRYLSIYTVVRNKEGRPVLYLNIPYFTSQLDLNQEISNFLVTIINLNAFIFLIAGVIALFITNRITRSFSVIGNKMKAIRLGAANEEIVWNRNDEIGDLVDQYNKMVQQLGESAEALAKSEREGAWREMARQVAHEIKNPLTPMKLSMQYLQKAISSNHPNVKDLTISVANTLIEQIDHLSKIAADFSQFANISNKKIELVDLQQVIGSLVDLYSSDPKVDMRWDKIPGSIVMKADKTQMNRVFTNLFANAVDACMARDHCQIFIKEEQSGSNIIISIEDNGEGIPVDTQPKIFMPNFTTKTSGTGLGLAMCKSIIEQAQGEIWFETKEGEGTTFFVQLPVIS